MYKFERAGWRWFPRQTWSTWSSWCWRTWPPCELWTLFQYLFVALNIFFLIDVVQIDSFRDLKDLRAFKVIKDHMGKGFLGQRYFSISSWKIHTKGQLLWNDIFLMLLEIARFFIIISYFRYYDPFVGLFLKYIFLVCLQFMAYSSSKKETWLFLLSVDMSSHYCNIKFLPEVFYFHASTCQATYIQCNLFWWTTEITTYINRTDSVSRKAAE